MLAGRGTAVHLNRRISAIRTADGRAVALEVGEETLRVEPDDAVVLAVPPWIATDLLPELVAPNAFEAILNIHFQRELDGQGPAGEAGFIGLPGAVAEWVFVKAGHVSVTISAANGLVDDPARAFAIAVWPNVVRGAGHSVRP